MTRACPVCKTPLTVAPGIGPYCAQKQCPVVDDDLLWNEDGTRKAPRAQAARAATDVRDKDLPHVISEGAINVFGVEVKVFNLSNGQRVISGDAIAKLFGIRGDQ